jgi:hypothetical protein
MNMKGIEKLLGLTGVLFLCCNVARSQCDIKRIVADGSVTLRSQAVTLAHEGAYSTHVELYLDYTPDDRKLYIKILTVFKHHPFAPTMFTVEFTDGSILKCFAISNSTNVASGVTLNLGIFDISADRYYKAFRDKNIKDIKIEGKDRFGFSPPIPPDYIKNSIKCLR